MPHNPLGPKAKAQRSLKRKQKATRPAAYDGARELCGAVGPAAIADEYNLDGSPEQIARGYASAVAHGPAQKATARGALDGFRDHGD